MEKLYDVPKNKLRKAFALLYCIRRLEHLQHGFAPIYDEDLYISGLVNQMRDEYNSLMADLQAHPDYKELVEAHWEEHT